MTQETPLSTTALTFPALKANLCSSSCWTKELTCWWRMPMGRRLFRMFSIPWLTIQIKNLNCQSSQTSSFGMVVLSTAMKSVREASSNSHCSPSKQLWPQTCQLWGHRKESTFFWMLGTSVLRWMLWSLRNWRCKHVIVVWWTGYMEHTWVTWNTFVGWRSGGVLDALVFLGNCHSYLCQSFCCSISTYCNKEWDWKRSLFSNSK